MSGEMTNKELETLISRAIQLSKEQEEREERAIREHVYEHLIAEIYKKPSKTK